MIIDIKGLKTVCVRVGCMVLALLALAVKAKADDSNIAVQKLVKLGFEEVSCTETDDERVYVLQNSTYRLESMGAAVAVDVIQKDGMPVDKNCRIVFLDNNIPQMSLLYKRNKRSGADNVSDEAVVSHSDWQSSYDLGDSWKVARKASKENRSLYKVDIVVYPQLMFRNKVINRVYDYVVNLSPAIEVSLWNGMKLTAQLIFPIHNDYGPDYGARPGYLTISQSLRFKNLFVTGTFGSMNKFYWGFNVSGKYVFANSHYWVDGEVGLYGFSRFWSSQKMDRKLRHWTFSVGGNYYWTKYNTQFKLHFERYLRDEYGVRFRMIRHFRYASIGVYAMKVQHAGNDGYNGGFTFQIALPPYKYKRSGYIPRVNLSDNWGFSYNAGNESRYGQFVNPRVDNNIMSENSFNPIFIKTELLNY